jgi:hypothetical protein
MEMNDTTNNTLSFTEQINRAVAAVSEHAVRIEELDPLPIALLQTEADTAT